ncbi:hypothetical protein D3C72_1867250 [compost metagenome]
MVLMVAVAPCSVAGAPRLMGPCVTSSCAGSVRPAPPVWVKPVAALTVEPAPKLVVPVASVLAMRMEPVSAVTSLPNDTLPPEISMPSGPEARTAPL